VAVRERRRLEIAGDGGEARIAHQPAERLEADVALADHLVAIDARAERALGVVQVKRLEVAQPDDAIEFFERALVAARRGPLDAGGEHVLRVEAHAEAALAGFLQNRVELFERAADARALAGGELDEQAYARLRAERAADALERARHAGEPFLDGRVLRGAGVHHHLADAERLGAAALFEQRRRRALADRRRARRQ